MEQLEQIIGYTFQNKKLLKQALTHSSYANEKKLGKLGCNERLEFLGDAVLELISSDFLYAKFTQVPGGKPHDGMLSDRFPSENSVFSIHPVTSAPLRPDVHILHLSNGSQPLLHHIVSVH